eukprot:scaffold30330_cov18-Prasinocladus_malaysianus.AAC.1
MLRVTAASEKPLDINDDLKIYTDRRTVKCFDLDDVPDSRHRRPVDERRKRDFRGRMGNGRQAGLGLGLMMPEAVK